MGTVLPFPSRAKPRPVAVFADPMFSDGDLAFELALLVSLEAMRPSWPLPVALDDDPPPMDAA